MAFFFDSIEEMGATYDPSLVDYIKFRFPEQVDGETLNRYLHLWAEMGLKYPATYLNAFINNYFEYVYPVSSDDSFISSVESFIFSICC